MSLKSATTSPIRANPATECNVTCPAAGKITIRQPQVKLPLQCKVHLRCSETPQHIASEIALLPGGRCSKSCFVENLAARTLRAEELKRHAWVHIRPRIRAMPSAKTIPPTTLTGVADRARMKLSTDQPPNAAWAILLDPGE